MKFSFLLITLWAFALLSGCIGTDIIDDTMEELMAPTDSATMGSVLMDSTTMNSIIRTGTLQGSGGYESKGTVTLSQDGQGNIILATGEDFEVEFALGTFLYLSNDLSGSAIVSSGLEIADISQSTTGAQSFNVTNINNQVTLDTYQYVIVLCKPAQLVFGSATLE